MLNIINSYWIGAIAPDAFVLITFTLDPLPPGTNVYATISLNLLNTAFEAKAPDPTFAASAFIDHWTVYEKGGKQSGPIYAPPSYLGLDPTLNSVWVDNCATITFMCSAERADAIAQISIFSR